MTSRWLIFCATVATLALLSHAKIVPVCDGHACLGPVIAKFPTPFCQNTPSFSEILSGEVGNGAQGSCLNVKGPSGTEQESRRWACSKMGLDMAFYAAPDCDLTRYQIPYKTESYTMDRCFSSDKGSFQFFCSNSSVEVIISPPPPPTTILPDEPLGNPYVPCLDRKCPPNVPYIATYRYPQCLGATIQQIALFENTTTSNSVCYSAPKWDATGAQLYMRYGCTRSEIFMHYFSDGCPQWDAVEKPVFTASFPLLNACLYDQATRIYFKYMCS